MWDVCCGSQDVAHTLEFADTLVRHTVVHTGVEQAGEMAGGD